MISKVRWSTSTFVVTDPLIAHTRQENVYERLSILKYNKIHMIQEYTLFFFHHDVVVIIVEIPLQTKNFFVLYVGVHYRK